MNRGDIVIWRESIMGQMHSHDFFHLGIVQEIYTTKGPTVYQVLIGNDNTVVTTEEHLCAICNREEFTVTIHSTDIFNHSTASLLDDLMKTLDNLVFQYYQERLWHGYTPEGDTCIYEGLIGGAYQLIFKALLEILHKQ